MGDTLTVDTDEVVGGGVSDIAWPEFPFHHIETSDDVFVSFERSTSCGTSATSVSAYGTAYPSLSCTVDYVCSVSHESDDGVTGNDDDDDDDDDDGNAIAENAIELSSHPSSDNSNITNGIDESSGEERSSTSSTNVRRLDFGDGCSALDGFNMFRAQTQAHVQLLQEEGYSPVCSNGSEDGDGLGKDMKPQAFVEPLLRENDQRFVLFPIQHNDIWAMYKHALTSFWAAEALDLDLDVTQWSDMLNETERRLLTQALACFALINDSVNVTLTADLARDVQSPEARCFYGFQQCTENVHSEMLSLLVERLVPDMSTDMSPFRATPSFQHARSMVRWALRWKNNAEFAERLVAVAVVKGVFNPVLCCIVSWFKKRGRMPGLCASNGHMAKDVGLHCDFACLLYSKLERPIPSERLQIMIGEAVSMNCDFVDAILPGELLGLNATLVKQFVKYCADRLLFALGSSRLYGAQNPFDFMAMVSMFGNNETFERHIAEYSRWNVQTKREELKFNIADDF